MGRDGIWHDFNERDKSVAGFTLARLYLVFVTLLTKGRDPELATTNWGDPDKVMFVNSSPSAKTFLLGETIRRESLTYKE